MGGDEDEADMGSRSVVTEGEKAAAVLGGLLVLGQMAGLLAHAEGENRPRLRASRGREGDWPDVLFPFSYYIHMHTYTSIYVLVRVYMYIAIYIYIYTYDPICIRIGICISTCLLVYMNEYTLYIYSWSYVRIYIYE
jgi:hypothetical protein